jgi:putative cell wall-binding protein
MQLKARAVTRARVAQMLAAALVMALALSTPAAAQTELVVDLLPVGGGPLDDLLPVDDDLIDIPFTNTISLTGQTPIEAAIALSQATFESADNVLLARADLFADAMAASGVQGVLDAPLLLTGVESLDARLVTELGRLDAKKVYIMGGTNALRAGVDGALNALGYETERVAGETRVETAITVAERFMPDATSGLVVRAYPSAAQLDPTQAYADLLAVGGLAADEQLPVFLTQTEKLTSSLETHLTASTVGATRVIGGTAAISDLVLQRLQSLDITSRRVAGLTRGGTAVQVANERGFADASDSNMIILAEGAREDTWAPGFAAAALAAEHDAPILLSLGPALAPETLVFLTAGAVDNLLGESPTLVCAPFVDPLACETAALALGQISLDDVLAPVLTLVDDVLTIGEELVGQVLGAVGMTVSGCGMSDQEVALDEDGRFSLPLLKTLVAGAGVCDLEFRVVGEDGFIYEGSIPVTLELLDPDLTEPIDDIIGDIEDGLGDAIDDLDGVLSEL